jgi:hypothetical protein
LVELIKEKREKCIGLTARRFLFLAKKEATSMKISNLKLSSGWFQKFCKRNSFKIRKRSTGRIKPTKQLEDAKKDWLLKIRNIMIENIYDPQMIINFDETSLSRDAPSKTTIDTKGAKKVVINSGGM